MVEQLGDVAVRLSRSPLGIIAFAFVFVYAIAALVSWRGGFESRDRRTLVLFLVGYPVLVLFVFLYLVTNHHDKLYAPSDFTTDESFLRIVENKVESSDAIRDLQSLTAEIQDQINSQPLYRYTRLSEVGKQLALYSYSKREFDLRDFHQGRSFGTEEVDAELMVLEKDYGWLARNGESVRLSDKGRREIGTFSEFAYGRLR